MTDKLKEGDIWVRTPNGIRKDWKKSSRVTFKNVMIFIDSDDIKMRKMFVDYLLDRFTQFLSESLINEWNTHLEEWEQLEEEVMEDET